MELVILDKELDAIASIELYSSLQWTYKYYDYDSFELECDISYFSLFQKGTYLFKQDTDLALIEAVTYSRSSSNEYKLVVKGRSISALLDDRVIVEEKKLSGTHEDIAYQLLNDNFVNPSDVNRKVPFLKLKEKSGLGETTSLEIKQTSIGKKLNEFLKEKELAQKIEYDYLKNEFIYSVWQGKDLTEDQTINEWVIFSDDYDNLVDIEYSNDIQDLKNFIYIVGKDDKVLSHSQIGTNDRRIEAVTSSSDSEDSVLIDKGKQELDKNKLVEVINSSVLPNINLQYKEDFNLGDFCTVKLASIGKMANMRITEINEIYEDGYLRIEPKFGEDYITITKLIDREVNK